MARKQCQVCGQPATVRVEANLNGRHSTMLLCDDHYRQLKDTARRMVYHALQLPLYRDIETIVRVNALDSEWGVNDLEAVVRGGADVVRLPKTDTAQDVLDIEKEILRPSARR